MRNYDTAPAVACLGGILLDILRNDALTLSKLEESAVEAGHGIITRAVALALESYDEELCSLLPSGSRIHERRPRTLATMFGDVTFSRRMCIDRYGNTFVPLDEAVDLARNSRVSPRASEFLAGAASEGSYAKAAHFMEAAGGSSVSARTVMNAMRRAGEACEEADVALAHDLYANGVLPAAAAVDGNLDLFHENRAIGSCFDSPESDEGRQVMQCIWFGRAADAADLLEAYAEEGLARAKNAAATAAYLRNNAEFIRSCPPSLGTMEAENEHLYASCMKSVPCGWPARGASDMARIRSRKYSGREVPMPNREASLSPKRRKAR